MPASLLCLLALATMQAPRAETALISDVSVVQPGVPFTVALQIKMPPSWHTYYLNPGEAGQATEIDWKLPEGFTAGPIQWPVPERTDFEGIASFVYDNEVWLLTTITPPKTLTPGKVVPLAAKAKWLLCSTGCVPQSADLKLNVTTGASAVLNEKQADNFAKARKVIPMPSRDLAVVVTAEKKAVVLQLSGPTDPSGIRFIPADADSFGANQPIVTMQNGKINLTLALSMYAKTLPKRVKGILVVPGSGRETQAYLVDEPIIQH
jgi:DsbC/DsbD-like thiol-disulfide interchange protein